MAVVTLRELIDRWEAGDSHAAELMERPWTPGLSAAEDEEAADAMAASLVPDVRRVCHLCSGGDARMWSTVLASLATPLMPAGTARPRSMVPSLLQRMRIQTASDGTPLAQEIDEACASTLQSYSLFIAGVVRLGRLPDYAMPFELAIAVAHGCTALEAAGAQEPPVKELLRALAESPDIPGQREEAREGASQFNVFSLLASCIKRRAAKVSGIISPQAGDGSASAWRAASDGFLPAIGDDAEADLGDGLVPTRVLLLEDGEALLRGLACGRYAWMALSSIFAPGASKASAQHRAVLGLGPEAGPVEAGRAYRKLARHHHPDKDRPWNRRSRHATQAAGSVATFLSWLRSRRVRLSAPTAADVLVKHGSSLVGKKVLVTGACNGIGFAVARALLDACPDCRLMVNGRSMERVSGMLSQLPAHARSRCHAAIADLSSLREVDELCKKLAESPPDVVVCCAGIATLPRWTPTSDGYESQFAVTPVSVFHGDGVIRPAASGAEALAKAMLWRSKFLQIELDTINSKRPVGCGLGGFEASASKTGAAMIRIDMRLSASLCLLVSAAACSDSGDGSCRNETIFAVLSVLGVCASCSCCVLWASWLCGLWEQARKPTLMMSLVPFLMTAFCALAPPLVRDDPGRCFAATLPESTQLYGLEMVLMLSAQMGVSWAGLGVSLVWLSQIPAKTTLGILAVKYSMLTALLNMMGLLGWTLGGCMTAGVDIFDINAAVFALSFTGSFVTNIILQKIVIVRTETHSDKEAAGRMRCTIYGEYIGGALLCLGALLHGVTRGQGIVPGGLLFSFVYILGSLHLLVFDGIFSWHAYVALRQTLQQAQSALPAKACGEGRTGTAVAVAKNNLRLVLLAVLGTSLHYCTVLALAAWFCVSPQSFLRFKFFHVLFPVWCLDSIFNDLCAVYIGCGPTEEALELVSHVAEATVVGRPTEDASIPGQVVVAGHCQDKPLTNERLLASHGLG
ncbi:Wwox [Symbiodinium microadriaticum]|nr:Wwox [Symbiodinium microadriaticum]